MGDEEWYVDSFTLEEESYRYAHEQLGRLANEVLNGLSIEDISIDMLLRNLTDAIISKFPVTNYSMSPIPTQMLIMESWSDENSGTISCRGLTALTACCLSKLGIEFKVYATITNDVIHPILRVKVSEHDGIFVDYVNKRNARKIIVPSSALQPRVNSQITLSECFLLNDDYKVSLYMLDAIQYLLSIRSLILNVSASPESHPTYSPDRVANFANVLKELKNLWGDVHTFSGLLNILKSMVEVSESDEDEQ